jgi:hypothetical protein
MLRPAERDAFCRYCDEVIKKGDDMLSFYSYRNRGQNIHLHPECVIKMAEEVNEGIKEND